jgi:hypothetical protein
MRPIGGFWTWFTRASRSRSCPAVQAAVNSVDRRMCSRLLTGSAAIPTSARRLVAVVATRSRKSSVSSRSAAGGAAKERTIETGMPAVEPGV